MNVHRFFHDWLAVSLIFEDEFRMQFSPVFFLRAAYALFLLHSLSSDVCFLLSGPTPIHAPIPRPITYSIGIGTSDHQIENVDASTQGGPSQLDLSSFLQDLSFGGVSSPVRQAPVPVLSPVLRRSFVSGSPPPARITLDATVNAVVNCVDAVIDAVVDTSDRAVQAVVEVSESSTFYDPPVEEPVVVASSSVPAPSVSGTDALGDASVSTAGSTETLLEVPDDFSFDSLLPPEPDREAASPSVALMPAVTSPMGPSLLDSDDEPIASRLPG